MINLYDLSLTGIETLLVDWGEPAYRAKQIYNWLYEQRVADIDAMSNLPKKLRERLQQASTLGTLDIVT